MKKRLVILLSMFMVAWCVGLTACGGSEAEEPAAEPAEEETAAEITFDGEYGYVGDDPAEAAVYEYLVTTVSQNYEQEEGMVSIPVVSIVDKAENEDGSVDIAGEFEIYNYTIEGDTLMTQSGGSYPGKMHLVQDGDHYKVESFETVGDGSDFEPTAKAIFGDKYDAFMEVSSDSEALAPLRAETIVNYIKAKGIEVTKYQDYGWDPVELPL